MAMLNNQMVIYMIIYTIIYTYEHYIYIKKWDRRTWEDGDWVLYVGTAQKGPFWSFWNSFMFKTQSICYWNSCHMLSLYEDCRQAV